MHTAIKAPFLEVYLAGHRVPPGQYRDIDTGREVVLANEDFLPASLDGRVAAYMCIQHTWRQHHQRSSC